MTPDATGVSAGADGPVARSCTEVVVTGRPGGGSAPAGRRPGRLLGSEIRQYDLRVEYFRVRGILTRLRLGIGLCALAATLIPLAALGPHPGERALLWRIVVVCCAASAVVWALRWWTGGMLSARLSLVFVLSADFALIFASTADADQRTRLFWFCSVSVMGSYVGFFHSSRVMLAHVCLALVGFAPSFLQLVADERPLMVVTEVALLLLVIVLGPMTVHVAASAMAVDARSSNLDGLTGVLNRRGFRYHAVDLLCQPHPPGAHVVVMVIDLDHFKEINDLRGHAEGDAVIQRAAMQIASTVRETALVGRLGGEEFAVVDVVSTGRADGLADDIRNAIAQPGPLHPVTASVGVSVRSHSSVVGFPERSVELMLGQADAAMYRAKQNGRNMSVRFD